ncbi:MAG: hypothetical protein Q4C49_07930 [Bacillota bacterium]|nr:hypothetical protein [Bacillota bacterium]
MFDPSQYKWLDQGITIPEGANEQEAIALFKFIDNKDWTRAKKNLVGRYYLEQLHKLKAENRLDSWKMSNDLNKEVRSWQRSNAFKKVKNMTITQDRNKFLISGMMIVMTGTILMYFLSALISQSFVIMFSIDLIVASVAFVLFVRNMALKYKMINRYVKKNVYVEMDVLGVILCICFKMILPKFLDLSLVLLFIVHFLQKKRFEKALSSIE